MASTRSSQRKAKTKCKNKKITVKKDPQITVKKEPQITVKKKPQITVKKEPHTDNRPGNLNVVNQTKLSEKSLKKIAKMYRQAEELTTKLKTPKIKRKKNAKKVKVEFIKPKYVKEIKDTLKFDHIAFKENDMDVISIPEFPEIKIRMVKASKHPYMCIKCDLGFWTKKAYEAHAPVHILEKSMQLPKRYRCDVCAKEFNKKCDIERHTRVHTGEKPYICNICNKRFPHNLRNHLLTHLHKKPYVCEICNKQFVRNDVLRRHLLTHSTDKPVKCHVCSKGFIRDSQLAQHLRKKHPGQPNTEFYPEMSEDEEEDRKNEDEEEDRKNEDEEEDRKNEDEEEDRKNEDKEEDRIIGDSTDSQMSN